METTKKNAPAGTIFETVDDVRSLQEHYRKNGNMSIKDTLLVYNNPAEWISSCPGSDGMVCCQYFVINFGLGCLFDCHYCYLQSFLNNPLMSIFGNIEDLQNEILHKTRNKNFHFRIGTGEYTDSLALENLTNYARHLVVFFAKLPNATLELKTKSVNIDGLLDLDHNHNTVVAWSINPQRIIDEVEDNTAALNDRLEAAYKVSQAGYKLAFHFDPLIYYDDWYYGYKSTIELLFSKISPKSIAWISIGSFRYSTGLKEVIQSRFPNDQLTRPEMVQGEDTKHRYFKTIREEMYKQVKNWINEKDPALFSYLCMETKKMWQGVYGMVPDSKSNLDLQFEKRRKWMIENA